MSFPAQFQAHLSTETQFDWSDAVFHFAGTTEPMEGALHALLECHYSVDILAVVEHGREEEINRLVEAAAADLEEAGIPVTIHRRTGRIAEEVQHVVVLDRDPERSHRARLPVPLPGHR